MLYVLSMYVCMYACMYVCMYVYICSQLNTDAINFYVYICMYVCMLCQQDLKYMYTYIHTSFVISRLPLFVIISVSVLMNLFHVGLGTSPPLVGFAIAGMWRC